MISAMLLSPSQSAESSTKAKAKAAHYYTQNQQPNALEKNCK
jgi:hypothetical protein